jgi:hypothetical protein
MTGVLSDQFKPPANELDELKRNVFVKNGGALAITTDSYLEPRWSRLGIIHVVLPVLD